uniref:(northern house mosquito) hypothetical protein n=1 Tax=Culex pipiens TaxID=7175 RepID=A0A8D8HJP2_CULPI
MPSLTLNRSSSLVPVEEGVGGGGGCSSVSRDEAGSAAGKQKSSVRDSLPMATPIRVLERSSPDLLVSSTLSVLSFASSTPSSSNSAMSASCSASPLLRCCCCSSPPIPESASPFSSVIRILGTTIPPPPELCLLIPLVLAAPTNGSNRPEGDVCS